jgi:hypothetical protein
MDICKIYSLLAIHWQNIKSLPIRLGIKMLNHVIQSDHEKENDLKLWQMWLMKYQHMDEENFMPFSKFCELSKIPAQPKIKKSAEELLKMADDIHKSIVK